MGTEARSYGTRITHTDDARHVSSLFWTRSAFKVHIQFFVAPSSTLTDADDKTYNYLL